MRKRLTINLIANLSAFLINAMINFFMTPYIVNTVGKEAYGYVGLANNFVNYAALFGVALNSMAGRFISIKIHQKDINGANKYYNSVLVANIISSILLTVIATLIIMHLDNIINVSLNLYKDVIILFSFVFFSFILNTFGSNFAVSTFIKNRLDLSSMRGIESSLLKIIILIGLFYFYKPSISYIGLSSFVASLYILATNIYYTRKLTPELVIKKSSFDLKAVIELLSSGIWNTIIRLGQLLLDGLDLLIANLYISESAMGTLALSKTIPVVITSMVGVLSGVFLPGFTIIYSQNKNRQLITEIKQSMKIMGFLISAPVSIIISYGDIFYKLWVPSEDSRELQILSLIAVATIIISGSINTIYNVFTVTNKLKTNAIWLISTGIINTLIVLFLLKTTSLGLFAIAGVSTLLGILRNLAFTAPFGAKYLGEKWNTFYPEIFKSIISVLVCTLVAFTFRISFDVDTWLKLFIYSGLSVFFGLMINLFIILNKEERYKLFNRLNYL